MCNTDIRHLIPYCDMQGWLRAANEDFSLTVARQPDNSTDTGVHDFLLDGCVWNFGHVRCCVLVPHPLKLTGGPVSSFVLTTCSTTKWYKERNETYRSHIVTLTDACVISIITCVRCSKAYGHLLRTPNNSQSCNPCSTYPVWLFLTTCKWFFAWCLRLCPERATRASSPISTEVRHINWC